jgi:ferrous iron transport protein B
VGGFVAKEVVISTMSQVYVGSSAAEAEDSGPAPTLAEDLTSIGTGFMDATIEAGRTLLSAIPGLQFTAAETEPEDTALSAALQAHFTPLTAFGLMVFVLLYVPCVATLGAIQHEFGRRWALFSAVYQAGIAWVAALLVYQGGRLFGLV